MSKSGIGAQLGVKAESTWGTAVTVNDFIPFTSEDLRLRKNYIESGGLRAGQLGQATELHVATTSWVEGTVEFEPLTKKFSKWLNLLHGDTVTPSTPGGATNARLHAHEVGVTEPSGTLKSMTVQLGRPDVNGTTRPFTYAGMKVRSVNFECATGGILTSTWELVGKSESTSGSVEVADYSAIGVPFYFNQGSVEIGDSVVTDCIRSVGIQITLPLDDARFCMDSTGFLKEPLVNGLIDVVATFEMEFSSLTQHTAYVNATRRKFEVIFTGDDIDTGVSYSTLKFTLHETVTTGEGPVVQGPDVLMQTLTVKALNDGTNPLCTIDYTTTDTTVQA